VLGGVLGGVLGVDSVQLSENVLLDEIAVTPSALTAKTPRMPPELTVNGLVIVIDQWMIEPLVLLLEVSVMVVSFLATFASGVAFDPLFGTR
jgi:hypothetical protein